MPHRINTNILMIINMKKEFVRVYSAKDIAIFTSSVIIGCTLLALPTGTGVNITGFFLIFAGIILAFIMKTAYKDVESGEKYNKKEHYFQQSMRSSVLDAIGSRPDSVDMSQKDKGNAIKLDVYFSKKAGKAYVQLFEYIPYKYEPCSKIYEYEADKVSNLIK